MWVYIPNDGGEKEMPKIEFRENKILKLTNVLSRKVPAGEILNQDRQVQMLMNWIKAKGYETVGPLILYSSGVTGIDAENNPIIDSRIMVQLKQSEIRLEIPYRFEKQVRIENCLFARFQDKGEYLQYATNKLSLHAYENDRELTGETYIVLIESTEEKMMADVFMPLKTL